MIIILLAFYLVIVSVLMHKYHIWNVRNVVKVALFIIPVPVLAATMLFTMLVGKITKVDVKHVADAIQQSADLIEDILKDEA